MKTTTTTPSPGGESHRIYWQHFHRSNNNASSSSHNNRRSCSDSEYITSSAAVRITPAARARDVTELLRTNLHLKKNNDSSTAVNDNNNDNVDHLVLVGTLFSLPKDYVQFEHEQQQHHQQQHYRLIQQQQQQQQQQSKSPPRRKQHEQSIPPTSAVTTTTSSSNTNNNNSSVSTMMGGSGDPFHLVHTLHPDDSPLQIRDVMMDRIHKLLQSSSGGATETPRTIISPKLQWFFVPAPSTAVAVDSSLSSSPPPQRRQDGTRIIANTSSSSSATMTNSHNIPNCIHLEGYCSSMEEHDDDEDGDLGFDDEDDDDDESDTDCNSSEQDCNKRIENTQDNEELILQARFPWLRPTPTLAPATATTGSSGIDTAKPDASTALSLSSISSPQPPLTPRRLFADTERRRLRIWKRERRRLYELCCTHNNTSSSSHYDSFSGNAGAGNYNINNTLSGFLLKRSKRDLHVWRRVHCVLDNDYLWFVSRLYHVPNVSNNSARSMRFTKHGRVRLTRALLLEPAMDYPPLFQTPHAFEVVAADGTSHVFRATSKALQMVWMETISERILQSFENSQLEYAQLVICDESLARTGRLETVAVQPLVDKVIAAATTTFENHNKNVSSKSKPLVDSCSRIQRRNHVGNVLRWGIEVSDYRDYCRHVQSILPPKSPVVVVSSSKSSSLPMTTLGRATSSSLLLPSSSSSSLQPPNLRQSRSLSNVNQVIVASPKGSTLLDSCKNSNGRVSEATSSRGKHLQQQHQYQEPLDPFVVEMIQSLWQQAGHLLLRAIQVGEEMYPPSPISSSISPSSSPSNNNNIHHSSHHTSMETLFRHIDYVITGRRRRCPSKEDDAVIATLSAATAAAAAAVNSNGSGGHDIQAGNTSPPRHHHEDSPPIDLFDTLLAELQSLAVAADQQAAVNKNAVQNGETHQDGTTLS